MKGHDAIAKALVDQGIDTAFGVVGDANVFIVDAMVRNHGIRYVPASHEASATLMALGFSRASGRLGAATVTHGPGLTNTITALVEAARSRTPMLLVAGDTAVVDRQHLQQIGQRELVAATGAGFEPIRSPATIGTDVANAVRRAFAESRPIVLDIPINFEWEDVQLESVPRVEPPALAMAPDPVALDRAVGIIASAARPIVLAGRGAVVSGAREALLRLGARLGAPLATTLQANGLFRGEPFNLGIFGTLANPVASEAISRADCVVAFGAGLNYFTTDSGMLLAGKRVVHCDLEPGHIGRHVAVEGGVVGDAASTAETIIAWLDQAEHKPSGFCTPELEHSLRTYDPAADFVDRSTSTTVDPRSLTLRLEGMLPAERTVVVDAGRYMLHALKLTTPDPLALVTTHAFGSIGLGMGSAIGAAVARPDRSTVLLAGDGGFMMGGLAELNTAVQQHLDLIVVVYNDGSYGAEHIQFHNKGMDPELSLQHWPEFAVVAAAMGATGVTVRNLSDLDVADAAVRERSGPVLIDAKLDPAMISAVMGAVH